MRFAHFSDTHLGYSSYRKLTADGYNQREEDVRDSFVRVIDKIIELKPDFCIHSGDLFDSPRPSNRNIALVLKEFHRLANSGIPTVVIAGNHETPKVKQLGHIFGILEFFPAIHSVYTGEYKVIRLNGVAIHAIPQCVSVEAFERELERLTPERDVKYNVLTVHAAIKGIPEFSRGDFNELFVDEKYFETFHWIALGHYHNHALVSPNAAYAGSTERFSFAEAAQPKGFVLVDLEKRAHTFVQIPVREMVEITIDPSRLSTTDLNTEIETLCETLSPEGKIVKFKIQGFEPSQVSLIDFRRFSVLTRDAVHSAIEVAPEDEETVSSSPAIQLSRLSDEFKAYLDRLLKLPENERRELQDLGLYYLSLVEEIGSD